MADAQVNRVTIPYCPRRWADAFHAFTQRFACLVLHRRLGKTTAFVNHLQRAALDDEREAVRLRKLAPTLSESEIQKLVHPPGGRHYGYIFPLRTQAKAACWDMLKHYARVTDHEANESELMIRYGNRETGNKLQLFGSDNPDAFRSMQFSGVAHDEFGKQLPEVWGQVTSKCIADHLGFALFGGTIKGCDQLYQMYEAVKHDPEWFSLWRNVDDSIASEDPATVVILQRAIDDDRKQVVQGIMTQDDFDQEWFLSRDAAVQGAWYAKELRAAREGGRITRVPYDPILPVDTDWDLGVSDSTAIWCSQSLRSGEVRLIDYYEASGEGMPHYIAWLRSKPYVYGKHWGPHDIEVREFSSGKTRRETAAAHGIRFEVTPNIPLIDGIQAARLMLARCWFDEERTRVGVEALRQYRKQKNVKLQEFTGTPVHDAASHGADAFRGLAVRHKTPVEAKRTPRPAVPTGVGWQ